MASILRGKIKRYPSGLVSVVASHVPANRPLGSRSKVRHKDISQAGKCCPPLFGILIASKILIQKFSSILKSGYGGLGRKSKASWKSLRNARERMAAIEQSYGIHNCGFLTITLPSTDAAAFEALARYSSYAMDRINRILSRYFEGQELARVSVWEYQRRGALHCHLLIASDCIHAINKDDFIAYMQRAWYRILADIGKKWECDMFLSKAGETRTLQALQSIKNKKDENVFVNFQIVKKSIVAYLSRYLASSNHKKSQKNKNALREKFSPIATWLQWNRNATKCYEKMMEEFNLGECEIDKKRLISQMLKALKKKIIRSIPLARGVEIKHPQNPYNIGLYALPANPNSLRLASILAEFIGKIAPFFSNNLKEKYIPAFHRLSEEELDVRATEGFLLGIPYKEFAGIFSPDAYCNKKIGKNIANFGLAMLDLSQAFIERFNPKNYHQMELNYGL